VKGGWESIFEVQGIFCKKFVQRPKNPAKGGAEWELFSDCRKAKGLLYKAVNFGT